MERQRPGVVLIDFEACNAYAAGHERADTLACPVLFVLGQRDMMTAPRQARELIERCRAAACAAACRRRAWSRSPTAATRS